MLSAVAEYKNTFANDINERFGDYDNLLVGDNAGNHYPKCAKKFIPWLQTQLQAKRALVVLINASEENTALLAPLLSKQELERSNTYLHSNDTYLSIVAHGLKRLLLSELLGISADELLFSTTAKGKPVCLNQQAPTFNISHSQQWAAIVIAHDMHVGVDIEFPRTIDYAAFADSALTNQEYNEFKQRKYETLFFLERWSQKEAISKACGMGLFLDFKTINTHNINQVTIDNTNYYFYSQNFLAGSISIAANVKQQHLHIISFEQIKHQFITRQLIMPCKL